jgi:hypothetical protein
MIFRVPDGEHALTAGDLLSLAPDIRHSIVSEAGVAFLLMNVRAA